jgi:hypothetical protein
MTRYRSGPSIRRLESVRATKTMSDILFESGKGEAHAHIRRRPHKRIRNTINQLPANPKITKFHLAPRIHQDIRGLDIPMDDPVFVV